MIISKSHKLLFVHIPKNGGVSMKMLLTQQVPDATDWRSQHSDIRVAKAGLGKSLANYYTFAFVRNPWDRLVSWYFMVQRQETQGKRSGRRQSIREPMLGVTFRQFICQHIGQRPHEFIAKPQTDYLVGVKGKRLVKNIYRFEQYDKECQRLCNRIGLAPLQIPHKNISTHEHYSTYYDAETQQIVAKQFAADCKAFGYVFESA